MFDVCVYAACVRIVYVSIACACVLVCVCVCVCVEGAHRCTLTPKCYIS